MHAADNTAKRNKAGVVELVVVVIVDDELRRARVLPARRKCHRAAHVPIGMLDPSLIRECAAPIPLALQRHVGAQPELDKEPGHHFVEGRAGEKACARAKWQPGIA